MSDGDVRPAARAGRPRLECAGQSPMLGALRLAWLRLGRPGVAEVVLHASIRAGIALVRLSLLGRSDPGLPVTSRP
jgi:hypothetical protein